MSRYQKVPVEQLMVDSGYQRDLDAKHVARIRDNFDQDRFGVLEVSQRDDNEYAVWDGQHRLEVARELGMEKVPCLVHTNLTPQQEAELFVGQRNRKNVHIIQIFKARLYNHDVDAITIEALCENYGFKIGWLGNASTEARRNTFQCVGKLESIYQRGLLPQTLRLMSDVWLGDDGVTSAGFVTGVARLIEEYGNRLDEKALDKLADTSPTTIIRRARGNAGSAGWSSIVAQELRTAAGVRGRPAKKRNTEVAAYVEADAPVAA